MKLYRDWKTGRVYTIPIHGYPRKRENLKSTYRRPIKRRDRGIREYTLFSHFSIGESILWIRKLSEQLFQFFKFKYFFSNFFLLKTLFIPNSDNFCPNIVLILDQSST